MFLLLVRCICCERLHMLDVYAECPFAGILNHSVSLLATAPKSLCAWYLTCKQMHVQGQWPIHCTIQVCSNG